MSLTKWIKFRGIIAVKRLIIQHGQRTRDLNTIPFEDIPEVSPALIKNALNSNKITFEEGFTCFKMTCTICGTRKGAAQNLYVNKDTGLFMCFSCKQTGQWSFLERTLSKKVSKKQDSALIENQTGILQKSLEEIRGKTTELKNCKDLETIFAKFRVPPLLSTLIENLDVRIDNRLEHLYFPVENVNAETVGYRKINTRLNEDLPSPIYGGLLIGKPIKNRDTAVLVPSIIDFIALYNARIPQNVVCLPNGVNSLPLYVLPTLERYHKLILWLGNDIKSWESSRNFSRKLGDTRCFFIRPNDKQQLPHLANERDYKSILSSAQPICHKSITNFAGLRADVLSYLQNVDVVQGVKWKRFPSLNKILQGHRRGELTIVTGPTGCGKTTFMSEYSIDLASQGVNTLWGSFEIQNVRLAKTMLHQFAGQSLENNLDVFDQWANEFEKLPIYFMMFHGQQTIKVVMDAVDHATYVHDIAHVIIDNVQFMMGIADEFRHMDRFLKQDLIIAAFRNFATRKNCHVTLVMHPRKERDDDLSMSSIFGGAKASQEADNILIIQEKRLTALNSKKYLQVCKNRFSGDLGVMNLDFDKARLSFAPKKRKSPKKAENTADNEPPE